MRITWLGTASLLMEEGGASIAIDPYLRLAGRGLPPFPLDRLLGVEAVLITHPHLDHFADIGEVADAVRAPVFVCPRGLEIARRAGIGCGRMEALRAGDLLSFGSLRVRALPAEHCVFDARLVAGTLARALRSAHLPAALGLARQNRLFSIDFKRDVLAFEVSAPSARVLVFGSAALDSGFAYPAGADAVIWPYQGRSDMAAYSLPHLRRLAARRVILDHFDDAFPPVSHTMDTGALVELAHRELPGMSVEVPRFGEPVEVGA